MELTERVIARLGDFHPTEIAEIAEMKCFPRSPSRRIALERRPQAGVDLPALRAARVRSRDDDDAENTLFGSVNRYLCG
jgi:hypothetical protein